MSDRVLELMETPPAGATRLPNPAESLRPIRFIERSVPAPGWSWKWYGINANPTLNLPSTIVDAGVIRSR